ncbi:uncharacterized protein LOC113324069 [Papaver somniferum]|uniref:uncharacterized protein LOC113324069 n=1 Tax=Papaver somniferum TaxID=3469 RepID=UPI000E6F5461|nr:uncharacterized protein LOC113324069 [Papaver somniferum]
MNVENVGIPEAIIQEVLTVVEVVQNEDVNIIKYVDGTNGTVVNMLVKINSWANVIEKEMVTSNAGVSTSTSPINHKVSPKAPLNNKYNFRKNPVSGVHGHVKLVQIRFLWSEMKLISDLNKPWIVLGEFNAILSQDEKIGGKSPNRNSILEFSDCLNQYCWIKSVVGDPTFQFLQKLKNLKKVLNEWNCNPFDEEALKELVKAQNDHASIGVQENTLLRQKSRVKWIKEGGANTSLFHTNMKIRNAKNMISELEDNEGNVIADQTQIADFLVKYFQKKFEFQHVDIDETLLEVIPKVIDEEDQAKLDVILGEEDIKKIVFEMDPESAPGPDGFSGIFYRSCAKTTNQFRPIGLSNVVFKIFTKLITSRMCELMKKLISPQQAAYVHGRNIHEQVMLASELVNEMKFKRRGGNVGMKLDIQSTRISVMVNGGPCGFFQVERVLRNISSLVEKGKIQTMVTKKGVHPTHLFFADDIFIISNGGKKITTNLLKLLECYQASSGQIINKLKGKLFVDGTTPQRKQLISALVNMEVGKFPDKYLGVLLAPGRITSAMVWPIMELLQRKLASWKGNMFSFQDRLVHVQSVLCSIPIYNMSVYKWLASILEVYEKIIRKFLWTGDVEKRKFKTILWKRVCKPYEEGGLGIKRLEVINRSLLMKMLWKILNSDREWALFFDAKFQNKYGQWSTCKKQSSVLNGLKWAWNVLQENIRWTVGNGASISVWFDIWYGDVPLISTMGYTDYVKEKIGMKVQDLIYEGNWRFDLASHCICWFASNNWRQ